MSSERHARVKAIFGEAAELPAAERRAYLDRACAGDAGLRAEVEELLAFEVAEPEFLERTPATTAPPTSQRIVERLQHRIGRESRYQVRGELARGGMGVILEVWDRDLRRTLAMKVVLGRAHARTDVGTGDPPEVDERSLGRFLEEAQVTGQLDHPGIVPVHELGVDADGQVYFTMRLVHGIELSEVFERVREGRDGWTPARAVGTLLKVCETMAYAHSKGVIHRDLKPANVMVGGFGEVYVMDWGLARVRGRADSVDVRPRPVPGVTGDLVGTERPDDSAGDSPLLTMDGDVIGTPAYMSPEQARGDLAAMGPASDVYSVGAILYQLLAGHMPYAPPGSRRNTIAIWNLVRAGPPEQLDRVVQGAPVELVAICEKAMAREPSERYPEMAAMAEDLRAYVEGRVVKAHRTGAVVELKKWVQRNRALAATVLVGTLLIVSGTTGSSVVLAAKNRTIQQAKSVAEDQTIAANRAKDEAVQARSVAERERDTAQAIQRYILEDMLGSVDPRAGGRDLKVVDTLEHAAAGAAEAFAGEPVVEAAVRATLARSLLVIDAAELAEEQAKSSLELYRAHLGEDHADTLSIQGTLVQAYTIDENLEEGLALGRATLERQLAVLGEEHPDTLTTMTNVSTLALDSGEAEEAEELLRRAHAIRVRVLGPDAGPTLTTQWNLAELLRATGRFDEALELFDDLLERRIRAFGPEHPDTLMARNFDLFLRNERGLVANPLEAQLELLDAFRRVFGDRHHRTADPLQTLAVLYEKAGRLAEARDALRECLEIRRARFGESHTRTHAARLQLAAVEARGGDLESALELSRATLEAVRRSPVRTYPEVADCQLITGEILAGLQRLDEAEEHLSAAVAAYEERSPSDPHPWLQRARNALYVVQSRRDTEPGSNE